MTFWKALQMPVLAVTCGSVFYVLGRSLLVPAVPNRVLPPVVFPKAIELPGWQAVASSTPTKRVNYRQYRYQQGQNRLEIEMVDFTTFRAVGEHLQREGAEQPNSVIQSDPIVGFYQLVNPTERTQLRACIPPQGGGIVTYAQFLQHSYASAAPLDRLFTWALGMGPPRQVRCVWTTLSLARSGLTPEEATPVLKRIWLGSYPQWQLWLFGSQS